MLDGHSNFVQGVAWDPAGQFIVTQSNDRTARVWKENVALVSATLQGKNQQSKMMNHLIASGLDTKMYKCIQVIKAIPATSSSSSSSSSFSSSSSSSSSSPPAIVTSVAPFVSETLTSSEPSPTALVSSLVEVSTAPAVVVHTPTTKHHLFLDEGLVSFFRRPTWTPDGSLLLLPAGMLKTGGQAGGSLQKNTSFIFQRGRFDVPIANLSAALAAKPSIGIRASPVLYRLRSSSASSSSSETSFNGAFSLPYRMIIAVATLDAVFVYDTQNPYPIAAVANMHLDKLTDLSWSQSGNVLLFSSIDGYCSEITFDDGELGERLPMDDPVYPEFLRKKKHTVTFAPPKAIVRKEKAKSSSATEGEDGVISDGAGISGSTITPAKASTSVTLTTSGVEVMQLKPKRKAPLTLLSSGPSDEGASSSSASATLAEEPTLKKAKVEDHEEDVFTETSATGVAVVKKNQHQVIGNDD